MSRKHFEGILVWMEMRVSNGAFEGMDNQAKVVSHRAYGFRKADSYSTAIWHARGEFPLARSLFEEEPEID